MAHEVKRRVDLKAAAMTTEYLQLCLKLSIQYHSIHVAACAVHPEQVQHAERTYVQSEFDAFSTLVYVEKCGIRTCCVSDLCTDAMKNN